MRRPHTKLDFIEDCTCFPEVVHSAHIAPCTKGATRRASSLPERAVRNSVTLLWRGSG